MSYAQGYNAVAQRYERRRSEAANAFNEYMKMYPQASPRDYQNYIDQLSGGSRYVRGGLPPQQVLQSLAEQNQRAYQQEQLAAQLRQMQAQQQMSQLIDANVATMATRFDNDMDIGNALVQSLGGGEQAFEMVKSLYPNGFEGVRKRQQSAAILQYMPIAQQLYQADPNFDISAILPPELQGNKAVFEGIKNGIKSAAEAKQREQEYADYTVGLQRMKAQLDLGVEPDFSDVNPAVVPQLQNALTQYKAAQQRVESEQNAINRKKNLIELQKIVLTDPVSMAAIKQPGTAGFERIQKVADAYGMKLEAEDLVFVLKEAQSGVTVDMQAKLDAFNQQQIQSGRQMISDYNNDAIVALKELYGDDGARLKEAGEYAAGADNAIDMLAKQFDLSSPTAANAIQQAITEKKLKAAGVAPDGVSIAAHVASDPEFQSSVRTLEQAAASLNPVLEAARPEDKVKTFDQYLSDTSFEWNKQIEDFQKQNIDPLIAEEIPNDVQQAQQLQSKLANSKRELQVIKTMLVKDFDQAQRTTSMWLDPSSQYDPKAAGETARQHIALLSGLEEVVDQKLRSLQTKVQSINKSRNDAAAAQQEQQEKLMDEQSRIMGGSMPTSATAQQPPSIPLPGQGVNPNPAAMQNRFAPSRETQGPLPPPPPPRPEFTQRGYSGFTSTQSPRVPLPTTNPATNPNPSQMQNRFMTPLR